MYLSIAAATIIGASLPLSSSAEEEVVANQNASSAVTEGSINLQDVNHVTGINLNHFFNENNVPLDKQETLIKKVKNNEPWDAYKPESLKQIPNDFYSFDPSKGDQEKYYRFEDGSFVKLAVEGGTSKLVYSNTKQSGSIGTNGSWSGATGTEYWDIKISKSVGTAVSAQFYADFFVGLPGFGVSKITNIYSPDATGFGVSETPKTSIIRSTEDTLRSRAALAESHWFSNVKLNFSWSGIGTDTNIGDTCYLYLAVVNGSVYVDTKLPY